MKNAYKLIAVDMDGTLLQSDKTVHEDTVRDIQAAVDGGIPVVYCTGRAVVELEPYFAVLPMMRYEVCYSGALVYDSAERKAIYRAEIAREYIEKIVRTAAEYKAMPHILTENDSIVSSSDIQHMDQFRMGGYQPLFLKVATQVESMEEEAKRYDSVPKINIYFRSEEDRSRAYEKLKALPLTFAFAEKTSLEMTAEHVTKATGLAQLAEHFGATLDETVGIGDADNDRAMLSSVGFPIAMGNANEEIKAICKYITKDNDHNGVGAAIRYVMGK